ncbi:MAG: hypothetical protein DMG38_13775 [Acidobacteria bacterium]|nr:MAG: hypothetical protein DMG38_13775 [Acidobacteriota bacterium]
MVNPAQHGACSRHSLFYPSAPLLFSLALLSLTFLLGGCLFRRRPAIPWATATQVHPILQERAAGADDANMEAPEFNLDVASLAAMVVPLRSSPPRPHTAPAPSPAPTAPVADADKTPEAPTIAPQLTQQESAAAQQETNESLSVAEKNLAATRGKKLSPSQSDLVSKIKGFLKDAREAAQAGDWARARNLAKKAQVLSEELVRSV